MSSLCVLCSWDQATDLLDAYASLTDALTRRLADATDALASTQAEAQAACRRAKAAADAHASAAAMLAGVHEKAEVNERAMVVLEEELRQARGQAAELVR